MKNIYFIRSKTNRLSCFFYTNEAGISFKTYEGNKWGLPQVLVSNARDNYTLTLSEEGYIYIFCSDKLGNIYLCTNNNGEWETKLILKNQSPIIHTITFYPLIHKNGIKLIYNSPSAEDKSHYIITHQLDTNGEWGTPSRIDKITAFKNEVFSTHMLNDDHAIVFYQTKTPETNLGYREINSKVCSDFIKIHTTNYQITDYSFLTTESAIHMLYAVKSMFSNQLIYKTKNQFGFTSPVVIWEGQRIENCLMYFIKDILYIMFQSMGVMFHCLSHDYGKTFTKATKYEGKLANVIEKAIYLSEAPMSEEDYFVREIYVNSHNQSDIQIIPELIDGFYKDNDVLKVEVVQEIINPIIEIEEETVLEEYEDLEEESVENSKYEYVDDYNQFFNAASVESFKPAKEVKPVNKTYNELSQNKSFESQENIMKLQYSIKRAQDIINEKETVILNLENQMEYKDLEIKKLISEIDRLKNSTNLNIDIFEETDISE